MSANISENDEDSDNM